MYRIAVAGAALAASLVGATPAAASVKYDPGTKTGFVGGSDVRKAFGWSAREFAAQAPAVVFNHNFWTDDTYSVSCGGAAFPVVHHADYGWFELTDTVAGGYGGGFRLTGPHLGISGTSVPPATGQPCPTDQAKVITTAHYVSTASGWTLTATAQGVSHQLRAGVTPPGAAWTTGS